MSWTTDEYYPRDTAENSCWKRGEGVAREAGIPGESAAQNQRVPKNTRLDGP